MDAPERKRFLDHFFTNLLPKEVSEYCADEYGASMSNKRLHKMANVIAAHCRNFKRNDQDRYEQAISDWEEDLAYLRDKYCKPRSFRWPGTGSY